MEYTSRPKARRAKAVWDYFMEKYPWMKTTSRTLSLGYSPNLDYFGPGWYMRVGHTADDTLYWRGGDEICYSVMCGSL